MNSFGGCSVYNVLKGFQVRWREQIRGNLSRDLQAVSCVTSFISNKMYFVFRVVKQSLKWGSHITYIGVSYTTPRGSGGRITYMIPGILSFYLKSVQVVVSSDCESKSFMGKRRQTSHKGDPAVQAVLQQWQSIDHSRASISWQ